MATMHAITASGSTIACFGLFVGLGVICNVSSAAAPEPPGAQPGDDQLTCEQIDAQATAETRRDQQERDKMRQQMRVQGAATAALITSAVATGGATAGAAQAAMDAGVDSQVKLLGARPSNPRMDRLRALWAAKQCVRK